MKDSFSVLSIFPKDLFKICSENRICYNIPFENQIATVYNYNVTGCFGDFTTTQFIIPVEKEVIQNNILENTFIKSFIENNLVIDDQIFTNGILNGIKVFDIPNYCSGCLFSVSNFQEIAMKDYHKRIELVFINSKDSKEESEEISLKQFFNEISEDNIQKFVQLLISLGKNCCSFIPINENNKIYCQHFFENFLIQKESEEQILQKSSSYTIPIPFNEIEKKYEIPFNISLFKDIEENIDINSMKITSFKNKRFEKEGINFSFISDNLNIYSGFLFNFQNKEKTEQFNFYFVEEKSVPNDWEFI